MAKTKTLLRSFAGGEVSPEMFGRIDDTRFQTGAARMRNFITKPQGPARKRPGTGFVHETKDSGAARLLPFTYSTDQTMVIEMGNLYFRFHTAGGTLLVPTGGSAPLAYVPNRTFIGIDVNTATDRIDFGAVAHNLVTGYPITFTSDNAVAIPSPFVIGTTYYAIRIDNFIVKVATTLALAQAGTAIDILTAGGVGGQHRLNYAYVVGDMVEGTPAGAPGNHHLFVQPTINGAAQKTPGNTAYWHPQPATGEYEIPSGITTSMLFDVHYVQKHDVMTLVHSGHVAMELRRIGATRWTLTDISFGTSVATPTGQAVSSFGGEGITITAVTVATPAVLSSGPQDHSLTEDEPVIVVGVGDIPNGLYRRGFDVSATAFQLRSIDEGTDVGSGSATVTAASRVRRALLTEENNNSYVVTAVGSANEESQATSAVTASNNNLSSNGAYNTVSWSGAAGAERHNIYKLQGGLYGYIGQSETTSLKDDDGGIAPDMGMTPPRLDTIFSTAGSEPGAVAYFEQRRVFAGSDAQPQSLWMTRSGTESDMTYHLPVLDDDRIYFKIAAREASTIRHVVPMGHLILLTSSAEYRVSSVNSDAITPSSISVRPQSYIGASMVQPIVVNNTLVFCAARGGHVREMGFQAAVDSFLTGDLSMRAAHLFDDETIVDMAYSKAPLPILWFVSSSGDLLGLTYVPDEQVGAWHWHDTDGTFESCAAVADGEEDRLYVVVNRTIDVSGTPTTKRYIERMAAMNFDADVLPELVFIDSGLTYTHSGGAATVSTISGLSHLNGKTVAVLLRGVVHAQAVVAAGAISITPTAMANGDKVQVGLPYTAELHTLPMVLQIEAWGQGREKNVSKAWVRCFESAPFELGRLGGTMKSSDPRNAFSALLTDQIEVTPTGDWNDDAQVSIRSSDPLPLTVTAVVLEVSVG